MPSLARASKFGVLSAEFPYAPKSGLWSSVTNKTMLRFAACAMPRLRHSKEINVKMKFMTLVRGLGTINQVTRMYVEFQLILKIEKPASNDAGFSGCGGAS